MAGVKLTKFKDGRYCLSFYLDGKRRRETFLKLREAQRRSSVIERLKGKGLRVVVKEEVAADESSQYAMMQLTANGISKPLTAVIDEYIAAQKTLGAAGSLVDACKAYAGGQDTWSTIATLASTSTTYADTGLSSGSDEYQVINTGSAGSASSSPTTNPISPTPPQLPATPSSLTASSTGTSPSVVLTWSPGGTSSYSIGQSTDGVNFTTIASGIPVATGTYTDNNAQSGHLPTDRPRWIVLKAA